MFIKICANTNLEDACLAAELGVDAVGFVFAPSKRQVTAEQVVEITRELPEAVLKVGVFTATDAEEILHAASVAGLNAVQLHSAFDPALVEAIVAGSGGMLRVLQVVDVPAGIELEELRALLTTVLEHEYVVTALLDASHGGVSGGTGKVFDWERVATVVKQVQRATGRRVIVAGGLNAENVAAAVAAFEPWGVDVASGVEASPGMKNPERLRAFVALARAAGAKKA
ncbi:MAG: phosphoribosylanthranilate isomerase [Acidobacteriaceae bacterium]